MSPLTWNADRETLPNGQRRTRVRVKWCNYLGLDGWNKIDLSPAQAGGLFTVSKAPYSIEIPTLANDWSTIQSTNRYDIWTKQVMPDAPAGIQKRYPTALPVPGEVTARGILFSGAFPALNADRLVQFHEQEVRDLIVFRSEPPGSGPVEVPIEFDRGNLDALESTGRGRPPREVDFGTEKLITHGVSFTTGRFRGVKTKAPRVWDSAGRSEPIHFRLRQVGSRLVGVKVIPRSFFARATFPVYADTTSTFMPDPDVESTSCDGVSGFTGADLSWADVHDPADGNDTSDTIVGGGVQLSSSATTDTWGSIYREFQLFDTSPIPDTDNISAATLGSYVNAVSDSFTLGLEVVGCTPASNTAIVNADYDQVGTTEYASERALSGLTTTAYNTAALNATGIAAIDKGGITKIALRLSADLDNSPPTWIADSLSSVNISTADEAGTTQDPYLEVVHAAPAAGQPAIKRFGGVPHMRIGGPTFGNGGTW